MIPDKEDLIVFKRLSALETSGLDQFFTQAAMGDKNATFRLGLRMYNMTGRIENEAERSTAREQAFSLIADAAARGDIDARRMVFDLARDADRAATDLLERLNEEGPSLRL